jgi:5-methylcytosine-specific restriction endonuclease McrA
MLNSCPYCGTTLENARRRQCGAAECKRQHVNAWHRDFQRRYKAEHGNYYSRQYDKPRVKTYPIRCARCGVDVAVTKADATYCSHACWYETKHAAHAQIELAWSPQAAPPSIAPVLILKPLRRRWYSAFCTMCAASFITDNPRHQNCSTRCGRRADKDKRRALERNAFVAPVNRTEVYERDQWTCQLCREPVARAEVVPHPQAPTIDHIVPLARGGTHEPANVQLAHYRCNSIKSDGDWPAGAVASAG